MASETSSVDVLKEAVSAAGMLSSSGDPETALANAYATFGLKPPSSSEPLPVRIVRLILDVGEDQHSLLDYLEGIASPLSLQPPKEVKLPPEDEEAKRYSEMRWNKQLGPGYSLFYRGFGYDEIWLRSFWYFPPFRIHEQLPVQWFDGLMIVRRNGQELPACEALPPQDGDEVRWEHGLPSKVRGLLDSESYVEVPTLFEIEAGDHDLWDVAEICCAFANKYEELFETEGSGFSGDIWSMWIEDLIYYPDHQLLYAEIGT